MTKVEFHCHTSNSFDCGISLASRIKAYSTLGFTHLAITDHDAVLSARDIDLIKLSSSGLEVIPAIEVSTHIGHIILLGCRRIPIVNSLIYIVFLSKIFNYKIYIPHPCRKGTGLLSEYVSNKIPTWYVAWFLRYVTYLEVWNPRDTLGEKTKIDYQIWKLLERLTFTIASDSHFEDDINSDGCSMGGLNLGDPRVKRFFDQKIIAGQVYIPLTSRAFLRYVKSALRYFYKMHL